MNLLVETEVLCPYCGERFALQLDTSQEKQTLIEDCTVCCQPITLAVRTEPGQIIEVIGSKA